MATTYTVYVKGMIGEVVFYKRKGKELARSRPRKYQQTTATKAQAGVFGQASRTASLLWQMLKPWAGSAANGDTWSRLNGVVADWLRTGPLSNIHQQNELPFIQGFQFNQQTALSERCKVPLTVDRTPDGMLQLNIPAITPPLQIAAPAHTVGITVNIMACCCSTGNIPAMANTVSEIHMDYTGTPIPAQQIPLPLATNPGQLTIVAAALQYHTVIKSKTGTATAPQWMPAAIVGAVYN